MPKGFNWKCEPAIKEKKKGRPKGGIITGIRKELKEIEGAKSNKNVMVRKIELNNQIWSIITIYSRGIEEIIKQINEIIKDTEEGCVMVGGEYNARTGREGGVVRYEGKEKCSRRSKDKIIYREGQLLIDDINEKGWMILNGCEEVEENGEWTYVGENGNSVIDYVIVNYEAYSKVIRLVVENRSESDHLPIMALIEGENERNDRTEVEEIMKNIWTNEGIEYYQNKLGEWKSNKTINMDIWNAMKDQIRKARKTECRKVRKWFVGQRRWHNNEWKDRKRMLRRKLRDFKKGTITRKEYIEEKKQK